MKLAKTLGMLLMLLTLQTAFAGHGRDGGWPQSIQLLRFSKQHLIELVKQATDQDIQDAIDNMHDRDEAIRPEEVNKELLTKLIESIVEPDVEEIEKSKYTGVRLFYYDDSQAPIYKIYATKNFYNNPKYQVAATEINAALVKEVQTLMLHEISHLWGFGEENGDINFARTFATTLVDILHGSFKKNYSLGEKMISLSQAFFHQTTSLVLNNLEFKIRDQEFFCRSITENGESDSKILFSSKELIWSGSEGHALRSNEDILIRGTMDDYLIIEEYGSSSIQVASRISQIGWFQKTAKSYTVCHQDKANLNKIKERFIAPYYTRTNLLTDFDHASASMFKFVVADKLQSVVDNFKQSNSIQSKNQEQIVYNIDHKIKTKLQDDYKWIISLRRKYTKEKDSAVLDKFNKLINSDLSNQAQSFYAQAANTIKTLGTEISSMKSIARRNRTYDLLVEFSAEFNKIAEMTQKRAEETSMGIRVCYREKRIGKFYSCYIETAKTQAIENKQLYVRMDQALELLLKKTLSKLQKVE